MPYLPHKTWCPDPVASAAAIPDEANCSWLHQSHHCDCLGSWNNGMFSISLRVTSTAQFPELKVPISIYKSVGETQLLGKTELILQGLRLLMKTIYVSLKWNHEINKKNLIWFVPPWTPTKAQERPITTSIDELPVLYLLCLLFTFLYDCLWCTRTFITVMIEIVGIRTRMIEYIVILFW